ncbi:RusA family crossover junction endodeoxyribonuclease [Lactococcus piscium]|nr:RusA family crossover junction endodeoxyribonuclease [Lactococcus paracarnosus]
MTRAAFLKKNQNILKSETWRVVKKPDLDNLEKSVLDSVNTPMPMKTIIRSVTYIHVNGTR